MPPPPPPEFPILVIDTASPTTSVGLGISAGRWSWRSKREEAGVALFSLLKTVLADTAISLQAVRTLAFCEGPGSMLGIRTSVMAIRTWMATGTLSELNLMRYSSLELAAAGLNGATGDRKQIVAIDARRQSWHTLTLPPSEAEPAGIRRVPHERMASMTDPVHLPEGFPVWNPRPEAWKTVPYTPKCLESAAIRKSLLRKTVRAEAWQPEPPTYQKWAPLIGHPPAGSAQARESDP